MLGAVILLVLIGSVIGPLAYLKWLESQEQRALTVGADVAHVVNRALGGESLISINAAGARPWRRGRVVLSVPSGYESLLEAVSAPALRRVPSDFDLVMPGEDRTTRSPVSGETPIERNGRITAKAA